MTDIELAEAEIARLENITKIQQKQVERLMNARDAAKADNAKLRAEIERRAAADAGDIIALHAELDKWKTLGAQSVEILQADLAAARAEASHLRWLNSEENAVRAENASLKSELAATKARLEVAREALVSVRDAGLSEYDEYNGISRYDVAVGFAVEALATLDDPAGDAGELEVLKKAIESLPDCESKRIALVGINTVAKAIVDSGVLDGVMGKPADDAVVESDSGGPYPDHGSVPREDAEALAKALDGLLESHGQHQPWHDGYAALAAYRAKHPPAEAKEKV